MKTEERNRLEVPVDLRSAQRKVLFLAVISAMAATLVLATPDALPGSDKAAEVAHFIAEMAAFAVATHVIATAWCGLSPSVCRIANAVILCFGVIAGLDLLHAMTHEAGHHPMLALNESTADFYWIAGRLFQLAVIAILLTQLSLPWQQTWWALGAFVIFCIIAFIGLKMGTEQLSANAAEAGAAGLAMANVVASFAFYARFRARRDDSELWLALSTFFAAASQLIFGLYGSRSVQAELMVDVFRLGSYACLTRALYLAGVRGPIRRLVLAENLLKERESELNTIVENLPAGLCRLDENLKLRYANRNFRKIMRILHRHLPGTPFDAFVQPEDAPVLKDHFQHALAGARVEFDFSTSLAGAEPRYRHVVLAPTSREGAINGVLAIISDVSERENAIRQAADAAHETLELKSALDAHAIVAVTDARGVITRVNDKFVAISQYPREELIGKTHRIINSGHHPKGFFADMWKVISSGEVWNGEICNRAKDGTRYWVQTTIVPLINEKGVPEQYIAIRADITKRKEAEAEAQRMALHDALTGLPNRRLMGDRLQHAIDAAHRERSFGALLMLDMDNFKDVNDSFGHAAGDQLLRQIASRITECVRKTDTVARLGGDEFVVILEKLADTQAQATANTLDIGTKILEALRQPYTLSAQTVNTSASIGVVLVRGDDDCPDEMVKQADMALYEAKDEGRNRIVFFDPKLQSEINSRAELLRELRWADERGELRLFYQPVVNANLDIIGVEGLIRWQQHRLGLVSPADFIPLAEQSNLIIAIGEWVLKEACRQLREWEGDELRKHWTLAVNVSAKQFHDENFVSSVIRILEATEAPAGKLRLELTESMMHVNVDRTIVKMQTLKMLGVLFALDDFGTGYSSLNYLKRLPLDHLKIDKSFVNDLETDSNDVAITRTVLSLAENMGLSVIAEGVETAEQLRLLRSYGCQAFQGYYFSKPVPREQLPVSVRRTSNLIST